MGAAAVELAVVELAVVELAVVELAEMPVEGSAIWDREITTAMVLATALGTAASDPRMARDMAKDPKFDEQPMLHDSGGQRYDKES